MKSPGPVEDNGVVPCSCYGVSLEHCVVCDVLCCVVVWCGVVWCIEMRHRHHDQHVMDDCACNAQDD